MNNILLLLLLIPLIAGLALLTLRGRGMKTHVKIIMIIANVFELAFAILGFFTENLSLHIWNVTERIPFDLRLDDTSRLFVLLFAFIWFVVSIYAFEYFEEDEKQERFFAFYELMQFALMGLGMASNIVTFYVFFESMTLLGLPLVIHNETEEAREGAMRYLFYSMAGAFIALSGVFILTHYASTISFVEGGIGRFDCSDTLVLVGTGLILLGFGTKAGMFPMHAWLPAAHPVAPAPASSVLSGIITKTGVLAIIRVVYFYVGVSRIRGTWVQYTFIILSMITVFLGSMLAFMEKNFKKRLAYSTVSQVSYILFGLGLMNPVAFVGAVLHVIFHSLIKNTLFMNAGAVIHKSGETEVSALKGFGNAMPVTMWTFTIAGIALVGIPPLNAFLSKWYLMQGALDSGMPLWIAYGGPAVLLVSALLTAGYLVVISLRAFFVPKEEEQKPRNEAGFCMCFSMITLTVLIVALGVYAKPLIVFIEKIAESVMGGGM